MRRPTRTSVASAGFRSGHDRARLGDVPAPPATTFARVRSPWRRPCASSSPTPFAAGSPSDHPLGRGVRRLLRGPSRGEAPDARARARIFTPHLEGTPAFRATAEFMCGGPVVVAVLSKVDAVASWRERIGPADPDVARETHPESLRAQLGVDSLRNVVHGSATVEDAARERALLFPAPLPSLVPKEYLLETLVIPGSSRRSARCTPAQPEDPYELDVALVSRRADSRRGRQRGVAHARSSPRRTRWNEPPARSAIDTSSARPVRRARGTFAGAKIAIPSTARACAAPARARHRVGPSRRAAIKISRGCSSRTNRWCTSEGDPMCAIPRSARGSLSESERKRGARRRNSRLAIGARPTRRPGRASAPDIDVERMERRLKTDALAVAAENGRGCVPVFPRPDARGRGRGPGRVPRENVPAAAPLPPPTRWWRNSRPTRDEYPCDTRGFPWENERRPPNAGSSDCWRRV